MTSKLKKPKVKLKVSRVLRAAQADNGTGFCLHCGSSQRGVEPDANRYACESCGERRVAGADHILICGLAS